MGIDPGLRGAVAVLGGSDKTCEFWLLNDITECRIPFENIVKGYGVEFAYIEKAQAFPGQGVVGMFNYGLGFGRIIGWVEALSVPYELVPPTKWQKVMHAGCTGKTAKEKSKNAARRLFPKENFVPKGSVKLHDGLIDALLIAEYGRRQV